MIAKVFEELDQWIIEENKRITDEGGMRIGDVYFKVVGQSAVLEANLSIDVDNTADVDAFSNLSHSVQTQFNELLKPLGKVYDAHSGEIWMPAETQYTPIFTGLYVKAELAGVEYVMVSKALKAIDKNRVLLRSYIETDASELFSELAAKYGIILESI